MTQHSSNSDLSDLWGKGVGDDTKANIFSPRMNVPLPKSDEIGKSVQEDVNRSTFSRVWLLLIIGFLLGAIVAGFGIFLWSKGVNDKVVQRQQDALVLSQQHLAACEEKKSRSHHELALCAADVDTVSSQLRSLAATNNATRANQRLKKALDQKAALEKELEEIEVRIFDGLASVRRPQDMTKVFWRELRRNIRKHRRLSVRHRQAAAAYEAALTVAATRPSSELTQPDPKLLERNQQRVDYLEKEQNNSSQSEREAQGEKP